MRLIILITLISISYGVTAISCDSKKFIIYYLPLDAEFYLPPSREYIMQYGTKLEMESYAIDNLLKKISSIEGGIALNEDYQGLRVLIIDKIKDIDVLITSDKEILSKGRKYIVDLQVINAILNEITSKLNE